MSGTDELRRTETIDVGIGGRRYRLRGEDPELLRRLAERLDATLRELESARPDADERRLAVLAALNVAADEERRRRQLAARLEEIGAGVDRLERRLESLGERLLGGGSPS